MVVLELETTYCICSEIIILEFMILGDRNERDNSGVVLFR